MVDGQDNFGQRLANAKAEQKKKQRPSTKSSAAGISGLALRAGIDFVVPIVVAAWLGVECDKRAGSSPVGLLVGLFLGAGAGVVGVYRIIKKMGYAVGYPKISSNDKDGDDMSG